MISTDCTKKLAALVEQEVVSADALLDALLCEKKALAGSDAGRLAEATDRKKAALEALELIETERRQVVQKLALASPPSDMQALVNTIDAGDLGAGSVRSIAAKWEQLRETLQRCRELNITNGQIVATMQRRVQQALNLLRGGRGTVATYGRTGATQLSGAGPREFARA